MAVLKNRTKRENFLVVSKIFLQDESLKLEDRGLLATMHSLPEDWDFTIRGMQKILPDGESKIKTALDRLMERGYVIKRQSKGENGKFGKNMVEIYERPLCDKPLPKNPLPGKTLSENSSTEEPIADNLPQYNNKKYSNEQYNTNQSINPSLTEEGQKEIEAYKELIAQNIKLDWLLETAKPHGDDEVKMVNEVYGVICNMVCFPRESVEIAGTVYPWRVVQSQFLKLEYANVAEILNEILYQKEPIVDMLKYLISALFRNSQVTTLKKQANMYDDYLKQFREEPY